MSDTQKKLADDVRYHADAMASRMREQTQAEAHLQVATVEYEKARGNFALALRRLTESYEPARPGGAPDA